VYLRQKSIYFFKNNIGTGITLVLWAGLWICYPFSSRRIPWVRSLLLPSTIVALSVASRLDPCTICIGVFKRRISWQALFFSLIRWGIVLGIMFYLFWLNPSRTAQLAFVCGMACLFLLWNFRKGVCAIALLGVIIIPLAYSTSPFVANKFERGYKDFNLFIESVMTGKSTELVENKEYRRVADGRLLLYQGLWEKALEKPFLGHGMGMMESVCLSVGTKTIKNPHNEYLGVAIQSGLVGLFLYCSLLVLIFRSSFQQSSPWKELGIFIIIVLVIDGCFNCALSYSSASRFYGILLAVVLSQNQYAKT
jgi:O-antigen ligase